jgi:hypothetical protein
MSDGDNLAVRGIGCAILSYIAIAVFVGLAIGVLVGIVIRALWR